MMHRNKTIIALGIFLFLLGCGPDSTNESSRDQDNIKLTKISTHSHIDQHPSNQAKEILSKQKEITAIKAVNSKDKLVIAIEVQHNKRLKLAKIRKKLTKQMKDQFPDMEMEFSTDKKIYLELEQLEKEIQTNAITNKKLKKKLKHIIKLAREKT